MIVNSLRVSSDTPVVLRAWICCSRLCFMRMASWSSWSHCWARSTVLCSVYLDNKSRAHQNSITRWSRENKRHETRWTLYLFKKRQRRREKIFSSLTGKVKDYNSLVIQDKSFFHLSPKILNDPKVLFSIIDLSTLFLHLCQLIFKVPLPIDHCNPETKSVKKYRQDRIFKMLALEEEVLACIVETFTSRKS